MTGFKAPTKEQVREALRRIPTPQLRRAFLEGLNNPLWLEPLAKEGVFQNPPQRITTDDGSVSDPYWPEIEYVVRVAAAVPSTAVDILVELKDSDNAWVRRALFAVGAMVPATEAARLKPVLKAWLSTGFGWRTDPRDMVKFAVNLITGGKRKTGEWVANVLFRPGTREDSRKPDLVLEDYWYEVSLPQVAQALGPEGLSKVLGWLVEYERATGQRDGWSFSRPSIREHHDMHRDVEDALVDATRDLAIERMKTNPGNTISLLLRVKIMLARRIAMFATTGALATTDLGAPGDAELVAGASRLLFDEASNDERCRVEFGELAREVSRHSQSALDPLVDFIAAGPALSADELRVRLRRDEDESEAKTDEHVADFVDHWEHSWLASVGADALPAVLVTRLAELDDRLGVIEEPLRPPFQITTWSGPNSPLTQDEMAAMSPEELVAHLESWHALGDGWGPEPSHEGQARELMSLLTASPRAIVGVGSLVSRLRPTYLRAILRAWAAAFKASHDLDWEQVLKTVRDVLSHGDALDLPCEGGDMGDDPDYTSAKQAVVGLIVDLVKKYEPPRIPMEYLGQFAEILLDIAEDETAWSTYVTGDHENGMDPLTLSLNWQWPILVRGVATLVGYGPSAPWGNRGKATLLREVTREDPQGASHAVVGENLGRFLNADETWTKDQIPIWFGTVKGIDRGQQVALSTAIAIHRYHHSLFKLLSPSMLSALRSSEPIADGWKHYNSTPIQRIGEWVVKSIIFGHADWNDPVVQEFFSVREPLERGAALGHVAWEFMHAASVEDSIHDRFADVWDARIDHVESNPADSAELREFYWMVKSGKFAANWWLPRLKRVLKLDPEVAIERFMIGKEIASSADVDARAAFDVTKLLLATGQTQSMAAYDLSHNAVPMVIAYAVASGNEQLAAEATAFMNDLGEAGNLGLAKQVQDVLDGAVIQQDVTK